MSNTLSVVHPETPAGYVFLTNIEIPQDPSEIPNDQTLGLKNLIRGKQAYDIEGNPIEGMMPVFASLEEMHQKGINPDDPLGLKKAMPELFATAL